ncbi:MAG: YHYH protein, partial [Candidatus Poseidoniales archaeon]
MLETIIVVNVALCIIFGTALIMRNYDVPRILGRETKTLGIAILLILAFAVNFTPVVSAEDSDGDGVEDALDECPDNLTGENFTVAANGCSYPSYLDNVWMCIGGGVMVQDLSGNNEEECSVTISSDGVYMTISTPGIANHDMEGGTAGNIVAQDFDWKLPITPTNNTNCNPIVSINGCDIAPDRGPVAVAVNGVPFYGPEDGPGGDAVAHEIGIYYEDRQEIDLGICGAHMGPGGYHYHFDGNCMHWHNETNEDSDYEFSKVDNGTHSPIIGFAFDGYPIYGSYGYVDGNVTLMRSNYVLVE